MNVYHDSESVITKLRSGEIAKLSIIRVQWPSGNSEAIRVHRYDVERDLLIGCNMSWDNAATEAYDLSKGIVSEVERVAIKPDVRANTSLESELAQPKTSRGSR